MRAIEATSGYCCTTGWDQVGPNQFSSQIALSKLLSVAPCLKTLSKIAGERQQETAPRHEVCGGFPRCAPRPGVCVPVVSVGEFLWPAIILRHGPNLPCVGLGDQSRVWRRISASI